MGLLSPVTSMTWHCFCFASVSLFFLELFLHSSPVACQSSSSSIWGTHRAGEIIFQCQIFFTLHMLHGVLKARILKWFAIPFSSGPHFVRTVSRAKNRFPNLGIWQRDWEPPENLTLKASGIWFQNFHRTGETEFWGHKKPYVYQDPGERSSDPTRDWARFACECPGVSRGGMSWQACCRFRGSDHKTLATCLSSASWQDLFLKEVAITTSLSVMYNSLQPHWLYVACQVSLEFSRQLYWKVAISFSGGSSWPRDQTLVSCIDKWILYHSSHQGSLRATLVSSFKILICTLTRIAGEKIYISQACFNLEPSTMEQFLKLGWLDLS